jgi:GNAT superfamily N-acetyltransferase
VQGKYSIEAAAVEHLRAIPAIEQAAASLFSEDDLPVELRLLVTEHAALHKAQRAGRLWVALSQNRQPVGFALTDIVDGHAHLDEMDVHPEHTRRGLGTKLLQTVIAKAREQNHVALSLVTFRHLPWNAPFYEKFGFTRLAAADLGPEMKSLLAEERAAGLNSDDRIAMRVDL